MGELLAAKIDELRLLEGLCDHWAAENTVAAALADEASARARRAERSRWRSVSGARTGALGRAAGPRRGPRPRPG